MSNLLRRCSDCNCPIGNRDTFCPRCGMRQPRQVKSRGPLALTAALVCAGRTQGHAAQPAIGSGYPSKPVRITFAPGGGTDVMARTLGQKLAEVWGVPFFVDNRAGASGIVGTELAARATPDGDTRFMHEASASARKVIAIADRKVK